MSKTYGGRDIVLSKWLHVRKLSLELLLSLLIALAAGACVYLPLQGWLFTMLDNQLASAEFYTNAIRRSVESLQRYVNEHELAVSDAEALDTWCSTQAGVSLILWKDGKLRYMTGMPRDSEFGLVIDPAGSDDSGALRVQFSDGSARAEFYFGSYFYLIANGAAAIAAFVVIVAVLLALIHRKTSYIVQMEQELKILEGGDLNYPITVRGEDELAGLARGIDDMRRSIIERDRREEEARAANHALITAMSHDLRTPLTALMGYLDLIQEGKCANPDQEKHFISVSRNKAFQIKEMSDKLFEYFLVYDTANRPITLEIVDAQALIEQIVEEGLFDLMNRGFLISREGECPPCQLQVNIALFQRLFGNLFSNIEKYAVRDKPVTVHYALHDGRLEIGIQNSVLPMEDKMESTEIGLKTCSKIMADHSGTFRSVLQKDIFKAAMTFPVLP